MNIIDFISEYTGALSISIISFSGSFLGLMYSNNKRLGIEVLSKNRQEWINDLRNKIAEFQSVSTGLYELWCSSNYIYKYKQNSSPPTLIDLVLILDYLKLLLNPNESKSQDIILSISNIIEFFYDVQNEIPTLREMSDKERSEWDTKLFNLQEVLTQKTQIVLKAEWKRVKQGK